MKSESAGQRPVARPLMNSSEGPPLLTPVLSGKEKGKLSDLKNESKKRNFAAQQLASLRTGDRLQTDEFDEMARRGVENSTIIYATDRPTWLPGSKPSWTWLQILSSNVLLNQILTSNRFSLKAVG